MSTPFGSIVGLQRGPISVFKGIRFATAERFAAPVPTGAWSGDLDATQYGAQAPQLVGMLERALGASKLPMGEDCLFLNVFTPGCDDRKRPVLVWIHGGAYTTGTGAMPWYDGSALCTMGDVVVVTVNYRLGAFGFAGTSNNGLRDQVEALRWVHQAIASFGGDPTDVTVFGESAGGSAVIALMAVPEAKDLFHRVLAMSPSINQLRSGARAEEALGELLHAAGVDSLDGLRDTPIDDVLAAQSELLRDLGAGFTGFSPCDDGSFVPAPILEAAAADPRPLVLGTTRDEMSLFTAFNPALAELDEETLTRPFVRRFGEAAPAAVAAYEAARPESSFVQLASAMQTDEVFRVPARKLAEARSDTGLPTWMYWFTWATPAFGGRLGSCHALDIPFAFHNLQRTGVEAMTGDGADRTAVADTFSSAVLSFARTGEPGWPQYDAGADGARATMQIDAASRVVDDPEPGLRQLWSLHSR